MSYSDAYSVYVRYYMYDILKHILVHILKYFDLHTIQTQQVTQVYIYMYTYAHVSAYN
jgi:hypothetical protein